MEGAPGTLYEGEKFQLLFKFSSRYPFDSPQVNLGSNRVHSVFCSLPLVPFILTPALCAIQVMFTGENIPVHPHVYSNGHICLSILTEDWSPALSVQSVCLSIVSMLSSCKEKVSFTCMYVYMYVCTAEVKNVLHITTAARQTCERVCWSW